MSQVHLSLTKCGYNEQAESDGYGPVKGTLSSYRIGMIWLAANLVVTTIAGSVRLHSFQYLLEGLTANGLIDALVA